MQTAGYEGSQFPLPLTGGVKDDPSFLLFSLLPVPILNESTILYVGK